MEFHFDRERREFVRVRAEVPIRYKFLAKDFTDPALETVYEGVSNNLSGTGLLLLGRIPILSWIPDILMQKIVVGINLHLPEASVPLKILGRIAWVEAIEEKTQKCYMGVMFREITTQDKDVIFRFIIRTQMPG